MRDSCKPYRNDLSVYSEVYLVHNEYSIVQQNKRKDTENPRKTKMENICTTPLFTYSLIQPEWRCGEKRLLKFGSAATVCK